MLAAWQAQLGRLGVTYAADPDDAEVKALQSTHVDTIGDMALICLTWQPDGTKPEVVEEVLEFLQALAPFFDERVLYPLLKDTAKQASYPVRMFANYVEDTLGVERGKDNVLSAAQRARVFRCLAGELLISTASKTYDAYRGAGDGSSVPGPGGPGPQARPRQHPHPAHGRPLPAAGPLLRRVPCGPGPGAAFARARDERIAAQVSELKKILDEERKNPGLKRANVADDPVPIGGVSGNRLADLESEIEASPRRSRPMKRSCTCWLAGSLSGGRRLE